MTTRLWIMLGALGLLYALNIISAFNKPNGWEVYVVMVMRFMIMAVPFIARQYDEVSWYAAPLVTMSGAACLWACYYIGRAVEKKSKNRRK